MKKIFKYELMLTDEVFITSRKNAKLLSVQVQHGKLCAWFEVDTKSSSVSHRFTLVGTGHEVPENVGQYVTTVQLGGGSLVLHVYYGGEA